MPTNIKASNITFGYENTDELIFKKVNFHISEKKKIGLIGKNGSGKSTLFHLLKKEQTPIEGWFEGLDEQLIKQVPQSLEKYFQWTVEEYLWSAFPNIFSIWKKLNSYYKNEYDPDEIELMNLFSHFDELQGYKLEQKMEREISKFGFHAQHLQRKIMTFSGGEKTKIALLRIIIQNPSLLLLDEPSNHLDRAFIEWLALFLNSVNIPFLLISHDQSLLNECTNETWELNNSSIEFYGGNYDLAMQEKEEKRNRNSAEYEKKVNKLAQLKSTVHMLSNRQNKMENFKAKRSIKNNGGMCKRDDGSVRGVRATHTSQSLKTFKAKAKKLEDECLQTKPWIEKNRRFKFHNNTVSSTNVVRVQNLTKRFQDLTVFEKLNFCIKPSEKVHIQGKNGSGKTTFLKILLGKLNPDSGDFQWSPQAKIGYYSQEFEGLENEKRIFENLDVQTMEQEQNARNILANLTFPKHKIEDKIQVLSWGQKSKIALAKLLMSDANVLVLDEPTNHLEMSARIALADALDAFPGTIILVSHDYSFASKFITKTICFDS